MYWHKMCKVHLQRFHTFNAIAEINGMDKRTDLIEE
jgi:hypothetical protein